MRWRRRKLVAVCAAPTANFVSCSPTTTKRCATPSPRPLPPLCAVVVVGVSNTAGASVAFATSLSSTAAALASQGLTNPTVNDDQAGGLSTGAIVGIAIGAFAAVVLALAL